MDLAQRRMRMDGLADIHRVGAHLDRQRDLADHVARMGTHDTAAQNPAVPMGRRAESSNSSLVKPSSRPLAMARPDGSPGEQALLEP
jgi:hypothetical protein